MVNVNTVYTTVLQILNKMTIKRVAKFILEELLLENKKLIEISKKQKLQIIEMLLRYNIKIDKVEAKENAYVNGGGISTKELNPKTFESKLYPKLFFIGETVDVHGPIGGYNITIALSSGFSCSKQIINDIRSNK
jgi:predicted flavoprotein YhiN